jgi:hypothetical protein
MPPVDVFIDDEPFGRSPFAGRRLAAGRHRIRFEDAGRGIRREEWVAVAPGRDTTVRRTFEGATSPRPPGSGPVPDAGGAGGRVDAGDAGAAADGMRIRTTYRDAAAGVPDAAPRGVSDGYRIRSTYGGSGP